MSQEREFIVQLEVRLRLTDPFWNTADAGFFAHDALSSVTGCIANGVTVVSVEKVLAPSEVDDILHTH